MDPKEWEIHKHNLIQLSTVSIPFIQIDVAVRVLRARICLYILLTISVNSIITFWGGMGMLSFPRPILVLSEQLWESVLRVWPTHDIVRCPRRGLLYLHSITFISYVRSIVWSHECALFAGSIIRVNRINFMSVKCWYDVRCQSDIMTMQACPCWKAIPLNELNIPSCRSQANSAAFESAIKICAQ